jgi:hypothetical protein
LNSPTQDEGCNVQSPDNSGGSVDTCMRADDSSKRATGRGVAY